VTLLPRTEFLPVRGLPLALHHWGDPHAPILLMIHGFLDHGQGFQAMAEHLHDRWHVIAPDMRGHGQSGWVGAGGNYHFADYYFDVAQILAHLGAPVTLLGHSMGGMISTVTAALHPQAVRSVVLLDGMGPHEGDFAEAVPRLQRWIAALAAPGFGGEPDERRRSRRPMPSVQVAAHKLQAVNGRLTSTRALQLAETGTEPVDGGVVWRHDPLHRTPSSRPFRVEEARPLWQAIEQPVLSIYAGESEWMPRDLRERHGHLRHRTVATLPGAGHNLHHEQPELLAAALQAWSDNPGQPLAGLEPGEPTFPADSVG
jgi:pimeloyl-ACP methyl ester carboxylesterase